MGRILLLVELKGGNDGLNTVVPYADDEYGRSRSTLRLAAGQVLKLDSSLGLHPRMPAFPLDEDEVVALADYLRTFETPAPPARK